uniref:Mitochondrial import inner membrane translocase subunit n=1 Tax=Amphilophus citrinellus TaxID=61819 RepID=A0A3Q0S0D5_AMPCI
MDAHLPSRDTSTMLRDFLLVYNRMTEICFQRCTSNFNYRHLTMDEVGKEKITITVGPIGQPIRFNRGR